MILDSIQNSSCYKGMAPNLDRAFDLLSRLDEMSLKPGKNVIDNDIYIMRFSYDTSVCTTPLFEYHKDYFDIQLLMKGEELIGYSSTRASEISGGYNKEDDAGLCHLPADSSVSLKPGGFALFFPGELHAPKLAADRPVQVDKLVVKVKV